jgi:PPK2 family polyphosphate:nucleotide phosphotransferase
LPRLGSLYDMTVLEHTDDRSRERYLRPHMKRYRIQPDTKTRLSEMDPSDTGKYSPDDTGKAKAEGHITSALAKIKLFQERLYAASNYALLIVLQAMDTGGKDGTIKHVMGGVNPAGCRVSSFKTPTPVELAHDFLWRVHHEVPAKGFIGIFNRSHYEDVLVTRVHGLVSDKLAVQRFKQIKNFEKLLAQSGTTILKFYLHISKDEQQTRLLQRLDDPEKRWKFNPTDIAERKLWEKYVVAYEDAITATTTDYAPWYVVPANYKWYRNLVVADVIVEALESLCLKPRVPANVDWKELKRQLRR